MFPDVARDLLGSGDPLGALVNAMLSPDPRDRPTAEEVHTTLLNDSPTGQHQLSA